MTSMNINDHLSSKSNLAHLKCNNDAHYPILTESILFQHRGHDLHVLTVDKMNNLSLKSDSAHLKYLKMTPMILYLCSS